MSDRSAICPAASGSYPALHQLLDAPPLHALDLRLDDLVYCRHPDFLYEIFVCPTNGDIGLVGSNCVAFLRNALRLLYGKRRAKGRRRASRSFDT